MSHSPTEATSEADREYLEGWGALYELLRQGKSWSGREAHNAFLNLGDGRFADVSAVAGLDLLDDGRGLAVVDWDRDGALDFWISNRTGPQLRLLRNTRAAGGHHLALRLEGRRSNRDAIGARVEVVPRAAGEHRRVASVSAGSGYLSQSSKWLHFGLGELAEIDRVDVRWPDGARETFRGLSADRRYHLVQGSGEARPMPGGGGLPSGAPSELEPPKSERSRTVLAAPLDLHRVDYRSADGEAARLEAESPVLVNLWASWCAPCRSELEELARRREELAAAGLRVLALSVDEPADREAARALLGELGWERGEALDWGFAEAPLLDQLSIVQQAVLDQAPGLAVPTSFLLDRDLRLGALYRGPVRVDRLLGDAAALAEGDVDGSIPFSGRWVYRPAGRNVEVLANLLRSRGQPELAEAYLAQLGTDRGTPDYLRRSLAASWLDLSRSLRERGELERAAAVLRRGLEVEPESGELSHQLGQLLLQAGRLDEAISTLEQAAKRLPEDGAVHTNLGLALAYAGRVEEAATQWNRALELAAPQEEAHSTALYNLAVYHGEAGRTERAFSLLDRSLELAPEQADAWRYLGVLEARRGRTAEAEKALRRALELSPHDADAIRRLSELGASRR